MFNKNYYNYLARASSGVGSSTRLALINYAGTTMTSLSLGTFGTFVATDSSSEGGYVTSSATTTANFCINFGTGNTPATMNDYKLANFVYLHQISATSEGTVYDEAIGFFKTHSVLIQNTTSNNITVSEYCIYKRCTSAANATSMVMMMREVLDEPFTLAAGESATFKFTILYKQPDIGGET